MNDFRSTLKEDVDMSPSTQITFIHTLHLSELLRM